MEIIHFTALRAHISESIEDVRQVFRWKILWIMIPPIDGPGLSSVLYCGRVRWTCHQPVHEIGYSSIAMIALHIGCSYIETGRLRAFPFKEGT